ncbi:MAG: thiol protease/hemagglutinin PrtT [Muribaculaceae bacterium]
MKKFLLLIVSLAFATQLHAEQIGVTEAQDIAYKFARKSGRLKAATDTDVKLVYTENADNGSNSFYVFNTTGSSFVIVSGESNAEEVLGYSNDGAFDPANIPPAMLDLFDQYKSEISYAATLDIDANPASSVVPSRKAIAPLCATKWNQGAPFNNMCPMYDASQRCVTGCTATAMAQVMKYHNHPAKGTGTMTYTPTINGTATELSLDFSQTTFDWNNMLNVYGSGATEAQNNAVATLMYNCGVACQMSYGLSSGATHANAAKGYASFFSYDKSVQRAFRNYYSITGWNDLVYNELANNRPVQYAGYNSEAGHSYVCDGYDKDEYFHINWGWGGMSDGYFKLSALTPSSQGIGGSNAGYNAGQEIIYNIKPDEGGSYAYEMCFGGEFSTTTSSVLKTSTGTVSFNFTNFCLLSSNPDPVRIILGVYAENTSTKQRTFIKCTNINQQVSCGLTYSYSVSSYNVQKINISDLAALSEGTYKLIPAYTLPALEITDVAKVIFGVADYCNMTVDESTITFSKPTVEKPILTVDDITFNSEFYVGKMYSVTATITNNGGDYCDLIYPVIADSNLATVKIGDGLIYSLLKGETVTHDLIATVASDLEPGDYEFFLINASGVIISDRYQISVSTVPDGYSIKASTPVFEGDMNNIDSRNMAVTTTISCDEGYYAGTIYAVWFVDGYSFAMTESEVLFIEAINSKDITLRASFDNLDLSKSYTVGIYNYDNGWNRLSNYVNFNIATGIDDVAADGKFNIYTNGDVVNVTSPDNIKRIDIFSLTGQQVANRMVADGAGATSIDVSNLTPGVYVVKVITAGDTHVERIVKK